MTLKELIEKLPSDLRPWAELWLPMIMRWGEDQIYEFIIEASGKPWDQAYKRIVQTMTVDEKLAELKLRQQALAKLNQDNAQFIKHQRTLFFSLLAKLILSLKE